MSRVLLTTAAVATAAAAVYVAFGTRSGRRLIASALDAITSGWDVRLGIPTPNLALKPQSRDVSEDLKKITGRSQLCRVPSERERQALYPWLQPGEVWRPRAAADVNVGERSPYPADERSLLEPKMVTCVST